MNDTDIAGANALHFSVLVGVKGPEAATAYGEMVWIVICGVRSAESIGQFHEGAEHGGAVIVGQLNESSFLHQAAEFNEVSGAFTTSLGPIAHVGGSRLRRAHCAGLPPS
jgi:hypothetical protein